MDQEQITIELDDRPAQDAVKRTNAGLESVENKAKSVVDGMGKQWSSYAETVIRISDRSKSSIDRTIASMQKLGDSYGKTEIEKLTLAQDQLMQKFKGEQSVLDAISASYGRMKAVAQDAEAAKIKAAEESARAVERSAISSLEREAALYGKTGTARLEAQQVLLLKQNASPELRGAIQQNYGSMISASKETEAALALQKEKVAVDQLIGSLEREAALSGKSGISKQIAERELLLKEWQHEPKAVDAISDSLKRLKAEEAQSAQVHGNIRRLVLGAKDLAEGYSRGAVIEGVDYLMSLKGGGAGAAGGAQAATAGIAGISGVSGAAALAIGGVVAALGTLEFAGFKAIKSLGDFGQEVENIHLRTGLAVTEVQDFTYAAKAAGQDVSIFERMMRGLSEATNESSHEGDKAKQALKSLGVQLRDDAGTLKPTGDVFRNIAEGLNKIPEGFQRDAVALDLFKRSGIEAVPVIETLLAKLRESKEIGGTFSGEDFQLFKKFREETEKANEIWTRFKLQIEEPIAAKVLVQLQFVQDASRSVKNFLEPVGSVVRGLTPRISRPGEPGYVDPQTGAQVSDGDLQRRSISDWTRAQNQHAKDVAARTQEDAAIRADKALIAQRDLALKLRQAEQDLSKDTVPQIGVTLPADRRQYDADLKRVDSIKAQIKAVQQLREEETKLQSFEKQMNEREGSYLHIPADARGKALPFNGQASNAYFDQNAAAKDTISIYAPPSSVDKILSERDDLVKHGANRDRADLAAFNGASAALAKEEQDWQKTWADTLRKGAEEVDKIRDSEFKQSAKEADDTVKQWLANVQRNNAALQEIDERNFARMDAAESHQSRMIGIVSGPDEELKALHAQLDMREQIRNAELDIKKIHAGAFDLDREQFRVEMEAQQDRYEFEEKILELKKRQTEEVQRSIGPLIHTLFTKPQDFGKQFGATLHEAAMRPIEQGISGVVSRAISPAIYGADGQGGINGAFKTAFGGSSHQDLLKGATDLNSAATEANTAAILSQTEAFRQQKAFVQAQQQNAAQQSSGAVGYIPAVAPGMVTANMPGSGLGMEVLQLGRGSGFASQPSVSSVSAAPSLANGTASSTIRYLTESDSFRDQPSVSPASPAMGTDVLTPLLKSFLPSAPAYMPDISSSVSPNGFPVIGQTASLGYPAGMFSGGGVGNAYSDQNQGMIDILNSALPSAPSYLDIPPQPIVSGLDSFVRQASMIPPAMTSVASAPGMGSQLLGSFLHMAGIGGGTGGQQGGGIFGTLGKLGMPGGTSGFAGPVGGGNSGGLLGSLMGPGGPSGMFGGIRDLFGLGKGGVDLGNGVGVANVLQNGTFGQIATSVGKSSGFAMAGGMLAMNGLLNQNNAGTLGGTLQGTLGGAMLGFKFGGPIGAAIGAGVGLGIGVGEQLAGVESPENEAKRLIKQIYSVNIDTNMAKQVVAVAQQKYGGHVSVAVRDPEVRKMILLYSQATGQKMPLDSVTPRSASLVQQGGSLMQAPTYQDGTAYAFKSSLPVAGGYSTGTYPSGPSSVQLIVGAGSAADLFDGRIANTVTPSYVQDQYSQAQNSSYGRLSNSAMIQQPGLVI
jgi:hypothetical protein